MTKDISLTGNPAATDATGLPPGPVPAKAAKPEREFASVMEQATARKAAHARTTRSSARSRNDDVSSTPSRDRDRVARSAKSEVNPRAAARPTKSGVKLGDDNSSANSGEVSPSSTEAMSGEKAAKTSATTESSSEAAGEESASAAPETEAEAKKAETPANIVPFPGAMAQAAVIIPFPVAEAQAVPVAVANPVAAGTTVGAEAASGGEASANASQVIVPLPNQRTAEASRSVVNGERNAKVDDGDGIDVTKLGMKPVTEGEETVDVRSPVAPPTSSAAAAGALTAAAQSKVISVAFRTESGSESKPADVHASAEAQTQLPGETAQRVESAPSTSVPESSAKIVLLRTDAAKSAAGAGLDPASSGVGSRTKPTGTSVAKQEGRMESMTTSEREAAAADAGEALLEQLPDLTSKPAGRDAAPGDLASRNLMSTEWQTARTVGEADAAATGADGVKAADTTGTVERISSLIARESALVKKHGSDSMAVVLRPDAETELFVHLSQRDGQIEATVRCERGDAHQLGALWSQLQDSLAAQKVRLAPLQETSGGNSNFNQSPNGSGMSGGQNGAREEARPQKQSMDDWPAPAVPAPAAPHVRGTGGSRRRRITTSRPGWETWA